MKSATRYARGILTPRSLRKHRAQQTWMAGKLLQRTFTIMWPFSARSTPSSVTTHFRSGCCQATRCWTASSQGSQTGTGLALPRLTWMVTSIFDSSGSKYHARSRLAVAIESQSACRAFCFLACISSGTVNLSGWLINSVSFSRTAVACRPSKFR